MDITNSKLDFGSSFFFARNTKKTKSIRVEELYRKHDQRRIKEIKSLRSVSTGVTQNVLHRRKRTSDITFKISQIIPRYKAKREPMFSKIKYVSKGQEYVINNLPLDDLGVDKILHDKPSIKVCVTPTISKF